LFYFERPDVIALILTAYIVATLYSLPPTRLKERGTLGLLAAAVAQRTLPAVIVFQAMGVWDRTAVALCVLSTLIGLRYILVHQILDLRDDARTGLRTFGTDRGADFLCRLISRVVFPLELASLGVAVVTMAETVPSLWALAALYAVWLEVLRRRLKRFALTPSPVSYDLLADLYFIYWPLLLAGVLCVREPVLLPVLALTIVWLFRAIRALVGNAAQHFDSSVAAPGRGNTAAAIASAGGFRAVSSIGGNPGAERFSGTVHRNEPCPCGSGKRYKHCHGRYA
jgi:hypothetical protein